MTHKLTDQQLDEFVRGYTEAALWSSGDGEANDNFEDFEWAPGELEERKKECVDFLNYIGDDILEYRDRRGSYAASSANCSVYALAGHDFWLTRNGHGAGFWDRGIGPLGERLTAASKSFGGVDLYLGDDLLVYS